MSHVSHVVVSLLGIRLLQHILGRRDVQPDNVERLTLGLTRRETRQLIAFLPFKLFPDNNVSRWSWEVIRMPTNLPKSLLFPV